jgi:uncharacterized protein YegL
MTRPGGPLARRELHFFWLADCSASMGEHGKIHALNTAIEEALPHMRSIANENAHAQILVRAVSFGSDARWHNAQPTPVDDFRWTPLQASGTTAMGSALRLVAKELEVPAISDRSLPPVLVLVSDGQPTDNFDGALGELLAKPWGRKAVRMAIAIGSDANHDVLQRFIGHAELQPLHARNPEELVRHIRWASTAAINVASQPSSGDGGLQLTASSVPATDLPADDDVW